MKILEVCVDTFEGALAAIKGGANRLELCGALIIGGTTPSPFLYEMIREKSDIDIRAMVRPRFGEFLYSDSEFEIMKREVKQFRDMGCDGVVFGILTPDGRLDIPRMKELRGLAGDMKCTLHRAFDVTVDYKQAFADAKSIGMDVILTSGQVQKCTDGEDVLIDLVKNACGMEILIGGGCDAAAITRLGKSTGTRAFHLSGRVWGDSKMVYRNPNVAMGIDSVSEYQLWECSVDKIKAAKAALDEL
ncbi:MAG: copper homeostasis protein CutC [Defluviitaleaceae bacterium]|nr:copper homeostasis protein CutC [Defluviitaleaceae bacterium]